jgi:hypothetical protein
MKINEVIDDREIKFDELADAQRGEPEQAMLRCQMHPLGAGTTNTLEHVGDLTNRMAQHFSSFQGQYGIVQDKVEKTLRWLTNEYGFERELMENLKNNYAYYVRKNDPRIGGKSFEELKGDFFKRWDAYSTAHTKLKVYNKVQQKARDAAVELGKRDFEMAILNLEYLKKVLDKGRAYYAEMAGQYTPEQ